MLVRPVGMLGLMQASKVEWLTYGRPDGEWRLVEVAIDGQLASFSVHAADWCAHPTEESRNAMLVRQAKSYLTEFGDFRYQRRMSDGLAQELYGPHATYGGFRD